MNSIRKGDIVGRKSYGKDILFVVDKIITSTSGSGIAILKGLNIRIQADSNLDDLELANKKAIEESEKRIENRFSKTLQKYETEKKKQEGTEFSSRSSKVIYTGRILHLDGDKRYSEKSNMFYRKMGLKAIVRNVPESKQPKVVISLIERYKPDILIVTRT